MKYDWNNLFGAFGVHVLHYNHVMRINIRHKTAVAIKYDTRVLTVVARMTFKTMY